MPTPTNPNNLIYQRLYKTVNGLGSGDINIDNGITEDNTLITIQPASFHNKPVEKMIDDRKDLTD